MDRTRILRAGVAQTRAELRINFLTPAFLATILSPIFLLLSVYFFLRDSHFDGIFQSGGAYMMAGLIGGWGAMVTFQVLSEMQAERTEGTLLRLRMLPYGAGAWVLGKLVTSFVVLMFTAVFSIGGGMLLFPAMRPGSALGYVALAGLLLASFLTFFPFGIVTGTLVRNTWAQMIAMVLFIVVYAGAGTMVPLSWYPQWAQWLVAATPFYWVAHLGRWVLLPDSAGVAEVAGNFQPLLATAILVVWAIMGYLLAPRLLRSSLSRETVGSFQATREKIATRGFA